MVTCDAKKKSIRDAQWTGVILYMVIIKDLSDKVKIKQRPQVKERAMQIIWGRNSTEASGLEERDE